MGFSFDIEYCGGAWCNKYGHSPVNYTNVYADTRETPQCHQKIDNVPALFILPAFSKITPLQRWEK